MNNWENYRFRGLKTPIFKHDGWLDSAHPLMIYESMGTGVGFPLKNEQFSARSRRTGGCAEAYRDASHKRARCLTPRLRKRAIDGWKLANRVNIQSEVVQRGKIGENRLSQAAAPCYHTKSFLRTGLTGPESSYQKSFHIENVKMSNLSISG
jgi:hypothetical protein